MKNNKRNVLETAYCNDFVDNIDFSIKYLEKLYKEGYLTNRHKVGNRIVYWLSEKGLEWLEKEMR